MSASYESLPVPPPSSRSSSRASPTPTGTASAFSLTGLKRFFGGAGASNRSSHPTERERRRDTIPEEDDYRPSIASQHLANVVAGLTGADGPGEDGGRSLPFPSRSLRARSGSRTQQSAKEAHSGGSGGGGGEHGRGSTAFKDGSDQRTASSSRSRSRTRAPSSDHVVLPDGARFVRPIRLSGASPSVRLTLQNAETGTGLSSSVGPSGSYAGRGSSEFKFPSSSRQDDASPTLSDDFPHASAGRPRRLSFTGLANLSGLAGRSNRARDDDAGSVWSAGTGGGGQGGTSAYELMKRIRNEGLSTRYWIKDESAKDCFQCGSAFTTFRRRHHCRICGQIFCVSCASTILPRFGNLQRVRVCDGCRPAAEKHEALRLSRTPTFEDDRASVFRHRSPSASHDMPLTPASSRFYRRSGSGRPRHSRLSTSNSLPGIYDEDSPTTARSDYAQSPIDEESRTASRQAPTSRRASLGGSEHGEIDVRAERSPTDGEEIASDILLSPALSTATAPFRHSLGDEDNVETNGSSSTEATPQRSEEPSPSESPVLQGLGLYLEGSGDADGGRGDHVEDDTEHAFDRSGEDGEVMQRGVTFLPTQGIRGERRDRLALERSDSRLSGHLIETLPPASFDMSLVDPDIYHLDAFRAAEAAEVPISAATLAHVRRSIRQALEREKVPTPDAWAPELESLLFDVSERLSMLDEVEVGKFALNDHVRVKRIPGGRPRDSEFVSGVVITKNLMDKTMPRQLSNPRIMLISFPLEFQRHDGQFLSLYKVATQEHEYLRNLILRVHGSFPHIILAERNVSQVALDLLRERGIVVARNVKGSAMDSIAHAFGAEKITSMNGLLDPRLGRCRSFRVQTFVNRQIPGGRKTFLRFEGESHSSCTVVLRGGSMEILAKVKKIIQSLVLVVYNAKLEGYLLHDEHLQADPSEPDSAYPFSPRADEKKAATVNDSARSNEAPDLARSFEPYDTAELTGSALVHYPPPYSLQRVAEDAERLRELRELRDAEEAQRILDEERMGLAQATPIEPPSGDPLAHLRSIELPDAPPGGSPNASSVPQPSHREKGLDRPEDLARQALVDEAEASQARHLADWRMYSRNSHETFDLRDHQQLFVLESLVLYRTDGEPSRLCRPPEVRTIDFYRESDTTIGQYLRDVNESLTKDEPCPSPTCHEPMHQHIRVLVHDRVVLRIAWHAWDNVILQGAIGLSSACRRDGCRCTSRLVRASAETARLSLAKFFDLSFHPSTVFKCLDERCRHDGQADHVRFWHYGDVRVSISMDYIDLRDIVPPPRRLRVRPDRQVELRNAEYEQVARRTQAFFDSVQARISSFKLDYVPPEREEECQEGLGAFSKRCESERRSIQALLQATYEQAHHSNGTDMIDVRRALQERSLSFDADWAAFVKRVVPSDLPDFRRASSQLKRIFPEAPAYVSPSNRIVPTALLPAIEVDEPFDGAEPPPPSPHTVAPVCDPALHQGEGKPWAADIASDGVVAETAAPSCGEAQPAEAPLSHPFSLSRSNSARKRRESSSSDAASDTTVCADGEQTSTLTWTLTAAARSHEESGAIQTSESTCDLQRRPPRRRIGPQIAALAKAYGQSASSQDFPRTDGRPSVRRSATERPPESLERRPRTTHALSDMDSSYARMVGVPHLSRQPSLAVAAARPTRIPSRKSAGSLALARMFDRDAALRNPMPNHASRARLTSPDASRASSRSRGSSRAVSPTSTRDAAIAGSKILRPAIQRASSSRSTIRIRPPKGAGAGSESSDARPVSAIKSAGGNALARPGSGRGAARRKISGRTIEGLRRRFEAEQSRPDRRNGPRKQARPVITSQPTHRVFDNITDAIKADSDDEDMPDDSSSIDESGGADDEFDAENEGSDVEDVHTALVNAHGDVLAQTAIPPALERAPSSSMSHALVQSHRVSPDKASTSSTEPESNREASDNVSVAASPAGTDVSTFPRMSEGESSGTERRSLFDTFTSLWNYRNGDFAPLAYPTLPTEHLYVDNPILLRDDEPTSIIAHALCSRKYYSAFETTQLPRVQSGLAKGGIGKEPLSPELESDSIAHVAEEILRGSSQRSFKLGDVELGDISARCTVFWAEQFEALRQQCGCGVQFVESLARCFRWDAAGGKSKVDFMKTLDDRFIVKQLSRPEMEVFARFAPAYFEYMADALFGTRPTVLAKVFGIYRISLGKQYRNVDFLVMENLFYGRELKQIFDLKGSTRNRRADENNPVLLDENLIDLSLKNPIYIREESKQLIKEAVWHDSQFLSDLNVMDYSLVIGVDAQKAELVVGIVDYIRTYTWDKRLESWVKETAFLGGTYKTGGPTVITPKQYKTRFREAIDGYLLLSPTPWLDLAQMRRSPGEATTKVAPPATGDTVSITDQQSIAAQVVDIMHPAPAPPPSDSASIFEAALGPF